MSTTDLNITEARRRLPRLIHDLERHPDRVFRIRVRRHWVAELKAPPQVAKAGLAADRLAALARRRWRSAPGRTAETVSTDVDRFLYDDR